MVVVVVNVVVSFVIVIVVVAVVVVVVFSVSNLLCIYMFESIIRKSFSNLERASILNDDPSSL